MSKTTSVIIPSATLVPEELQNIGKLPAIIYPINQDIVFDYLYKQYKDLNGTIDIICYEAKDKVKRRLASYDGKKVNIIDIPELTDLGHTVYYALEGVTAPVFVNFADTIIMDDIIDTDDDTVFYSVDYLSDTWTFFETENGVITSIIDKVKQNSEVQKKLFVGLFKITEPQLFRECLEKSFGRNDLTMSTFYAALCTYSEQKPFNSVEVENWFDIGHADTYYNSQLEVKAREFNHISVDKDRGILRKTSDDKEKFIGEILWYLKLPADIEYVRPRIFDYSTSYSAPYVSMEYYAYHTVHELFMYGDLNYHQWVDVFNRIRFVCNDFARYTVSDEKIKPALEDMYLTKTVQRFDKLRADERFVRFFNEPITVNGIEYKSLDGITDLLKKIIPEMLYDIEKFSIIHGDLCFANIMVDGNFSFIKVIDPRGKFGTFDIYGDSRYELAKLFHSVDGKYDFIIKDQFSIDYNADENRINYSINDRSRDYDLYKLFTEVFKNEIGNDLKKIELIESLLFLSMIPLHGESFEHQLVMLGTGIEILNRVVDIKE